MSNARLKLAKKAKAEPHLEAERLLFENYCLHQVRPFK